MTQAQTQPLRIGVLALQGAFREHINILQALSAQPVVPLDQLSEAAGEWTGTSYHLDSAVPVRTTQELHAVDGLIIPGGESTTMALVAERSGLWDDLAAFTRTKPVWGTCAGMILLARSASGTKQGGQRLLQTLNAHVQRNHFGSQLASFEATMEAPSLSLALGTDTPFRAVFIRAPVIQDFDPEEVQVLARVPVPGSGTTPDTVVVAVRQHFCLATAFHPELTLDTRWHRYFLALVAQFKGSEPALATT
ncbi:Senecionine N-oxygenase [Tieghemiomyces parasiticus]|uniref:glutaminase n=1 Tax=Tieghemiomyces parasiticus TaxID=78921 RepID=A0A9W8DWQ1_9FUNG|nr:Senecionine N-oxygenase [Tieghemiomyces parasiticus]